MAEVLRLDIILRRSWRERGSSIHFPSLNFDKSYYPNALGMFDISTYRKYRYWIQYRYIGMTISVIPIYGNFCAYQNSWRDNIINFASLQYEDSFLAAIPPKQLRSIQHYTVVNSILQIYKIGFSCLLTRLKSQYTDNIGILLPVYRYRIFLIPSDPTVHKSYRPSGPVTLKSWPFSHFLYPVLAWPKTRPKTRKLPTPILPLAKELVLNSEFFVPPPYLSRMAHPSIGLMRYWRIHYRTKFYFKQLQREFYLSMYKFISRYILQ